MAARHPGPPVPTSSGSVVPMGARALARSAKKAQEAVDNENRAPTSSMRIDTKRPGRAEAAMRTVVDMTYTTALDITIRKATH